MCKATNCAKVTKIAKNFSLKRRGKGGQDCTHLYESQCFSPPPPRGYLNWDTTDNNKIFDICIPRSSIHFHQLTQPIISHGVLHDKGNHQLPTWDYLLNKIYTISMCMLRFWTINIQLQCIKRSDRKRKQNFSWPRTNHNNRPKITSIANCSRKKLIPEWLCVITIFFKTRINSCQ